MLGIGRRTALRMIERGQLPAQKMVGHTATYVLDRAAVGSLAREKRATPEG